MRELYIITTNRELLKGKLLDIQADFEKGEANCQLEITKGRVKTGPSGLIGIVDLLDKYHWPRDKYQG